MSKYEDATFTIYSTKGNYYEADEIERENLNKVIDIIKQAEKQEILLNKVKEIIDRPFDTVFPTMLEQAERYVEIHKLIKEEVND